MGLELHDSFKDALEDDVSKSKPSKSERELLADFREATESYLNSPLCMSMMSTLTLLRASGENPRVVVKLKQRQLRVSLHRSNGEVQHFNRDGKS